MTKDGTQFIFETVLYTAIRDGLEVELKEAISEFNIFENLDKTYLTASMLIGDDMGLMSDIQIKGDEGVKIIIAKNPKLGDSSPYFRLDFKVVSILREEKTADRSEVYSINLISKHGYDNSVAKLSKSFTGKLEKISENILENYLDVRLSMDEKYVGREGSEQEVVKVLLPYISPLESVEWLTERATDRWGTPFFIWASIWGQGMSPSTTLRLGNFMTMVQEGINNLPPPGNLDFIYSQVSTNENSPEGYQGAKRIIKNIEFSNIENTLKMVQEGAVGSVISNLDTYTSQDVSKHFDLKEFLQSLNGGEENGKILGSVYDQKDEIKLGGETLSTSEWPARQRSTVSSYGTYANVNSIHEAIDESALLNKVRPLSIRSMLSRNMLEINIDGIGLLEDRLSVGDIIRIRFLTSDTERDAEINEGTERSGYYLIQNCRHIFTRERHNAVLFVSKIAASDIANDGSVFAS